MTASEQSYNQWFKANWKWLVPYLIIAWSGHIGLGMALAVFGPTQPYLGMKKICLKMIGPVHSNNEKTNQHRIEYYPDYFFLM